MEFIFSYLQGKGKEKPNRTDEDDNDDLESVASEEFEEMLDKMSGLPKDDEDLDYMNDIGANLKKKVDDSEGSEDEEMAEDEGEESFEENMSDDELDEDETIDNLGEDEGTSLISSLLLYTVFNNKLLHFIY